MGHLRVVCHPLPLLRTVWCPIAQDCCDQRRSVRHSLGSRRIAWLPTLDRSQTCPRVVGHRDGVNGTASHRTSAPARCRHGDRPSDCHRTACRCAFHRSAWIRAAVHRSQSVPRLRLTADPTPRLTHADHPIPRLAHAAGRSPHGVPNVAPSGSSGRLGRRSARSVRSVNRIASHPYVRRSVSPRAMTSGRVGRCRSYDQDPAVV